jgi:hypothetical protein
MTFRQATCTLIFIASSTLAGLTAIHFIWLHPAVIGPFALPIGMTPMVLLFEYSFPVPGDYFAPVLVLAGASWLASWRYPPPVLIGRIVLLCGLFLAGLSVTIFVLTSAYYNVGMAGEIPPGWYRLVRPGTRAGEVGLVLVIVGLILDRSGVRSFVFGRNEKKS